VPDTRLQRQYGQLNRDSVSNGDQSETESDLQRRKTRPNFDQPADEFGDVYLVDLQFRFGLAESANLKMN
jgi:hypothetical protein